MFSNALRGALIALTSLAIGVSATSSLSLSIAGPDTVDTVENLKITATVTNTGDEIVKVLNDPRGPLSSVPTDTFAITDTSGAQPSFTGIKLKYVPATAAALGGFTVLEPGQSVKVEHDLSQAYNFTAPGAGSYDIEASNQFYIVNPDNSVGSIFAQHASHRTSLSGKGKLAVTRPALARRATFNGCSSSEQSSILSGASAAQNYASAASSYASSHTTATTRYTTWFGTFTTARHSTIVSHFSKISSNTFSTFTFDCTCPDADSNTYAYVFPEQFGQIFLCGAFWNAPTTGTDSKGGTIIHESSHFTSNGGTDDNAYGQSAAKSLAISDPASAVDNADSHEYFAENNPALA